MAGILQSVHDALFGGKPNRWNQKQWDNFCESYAQMEKGVFSLTVHRPTPLFQFLSTDLCTDFVDFPNAPNGGGTARFACKP